MPLTDPLLASATSTIKDATYADVTAAIIGCYSPYAVRTLSVNEEIYEAEAATNQRNVAIAELMRAKVTVRESACPPVASDRSKQAKAALQKLTYLLQMDQNTDRRNARRSSVAVVRANRSTTRRTMRA